VLTSSLVQSLKPRAVRTRIFFLRALNSSRFRIWCLEFSSFVFVSNFGSFDIAQDTFRASSLFVLFLGVPVDVARGHALREMFSSNPRPRGEGMGEGRQPSNYPRRLLVKERPRPPPRMFYRSTTRPWGSPQAFYGSRVFPNWSVV